MVEGLTPSVLGHLGDQPPGRGEGVADSQRVARVWGATGTLRGSRVPPAPCSSQAPRGQSHPGWGWGGWGLNHSRVPPLKSIFEGCSIKHTRPLEIVAMRS